MNEKEIELVVKIKKLVKEEGFRLRHLNFHDESTGKLGEYREILSMEAEKEGR